MRMGDVTIFSDPFTPPLSLFSKTLSHTPVTSICNDPKKVKDRDNEFLYFNLAFVGLINTNLDFSF